MEFFTSDELCEYCNEKLPLHGIVEKVEGKEKNASDFYYIKLPDEWNNFSEGLVKASENLFKVKEAANSFFSQFPLKTV